MYNIAICDDDKVFIEFVKSIIKELNFANEVRIYEYLSGEEFIFDIDNRYDLDLLILDSKSTTLVFCSGIYKPSPENIKVSPFRFLLKEYSKQKMLEEFAEIFEYLKTKKEEPIVVCYDNRNHIQVYPYEILYISISKRGTKVHTYCEGNKETVEKIYSCKEKLESLYEILKDYNFVYAHNSYIVNLKYIKKLSKDEMQMISGEILSVSRARSKELKEKMTLYFETKYR